GERPDLDVFTEPGQWGNHSGGGNSATRRKGHYATPQSLRSASHERRLRIFPRFSWAGASLSVFRPISIYTGKHARKTIPVCPRRAKRLRGCCRSQKSANAGLRIQ